MVLGTKGPYLAKGRGTIRAAQYNGEISKARRACPNSLQDLREMLL